MSTVQFPSDTAKLDEFERVYRIFDANGDGHLTHQEITDALEVLGRDISPRDRTDLFERLSDGVVTHESFIEWMSQRTCDRFLS